MKILHDTQCRNGELLIIHHSIRSFMKNFNELGAFLHSLNKTVDVLILTETWFSDKKIVEIDGYTSFHSYRETKAGGGVSLYIKNCFASSCSLEFSQNNTIWEICSVKLNINSYMCNIISIYRPPDKALIPMFNDKLVELLSSNEMRKL